MPLQPPNAPINFHRPAAPRMPENHRADHKIFFPIKAFSVSSESLAPVGAGG